MSAHLVVERVRVISGGVEVPFIPVPDGERMQRDRNAQLFLKEASRRGLVVQGGRTVFRDTNEPI